MTSRAISLPFSFDSSGGVSYTTDNKKMWQDRVVLVVMTLLKERVMRPTFGSSAKATVFENVTSALILIRREVEHAFASWLRPLSLTDVKGTIDPTDGNLNIEVTYSLGTTNIYESVTIKTEIISRSGDTLLEITNG